MVQELGTSRGRGANFEAVQERMLVGERLGSDKFSTDFPDKYHGTGRNIVRNTIYELAYYIFAKNPLQSTTVLSSRRRDTWELAGRPTHCTYLEMLLGGSNSWRIYTKTAGQD